MIKQCSKVPDAKFGKYSVDRVLVDEEAVGTLDTPGHGAKILRKNTGSDKIASQTKSRVTKVCTLIPMYIGF